MLSVDEINAAEQREAGNEWVWGSYQLLDEGPSGSWDRCLVKLSPGGKDAKVIREFDLTSKTFVEGGFETTEPNKVEVNFRRRDELLIGTDFDGTGASLTDSGYPRVTAAPLPSFQRAAWAAGPYVRPFTAACAISSQPSIDPRVGTARSSKAGSVVRRSATR